MPYVNVVLKNGTQIPVPDADVAEWVSERLAASSSVPASTLRLICRQGERVLARFDAHDASGYVWRDGSSPS